MMLTTTRMTAALAAAGAVAFGLAVLDGQGRGGAEWTTGAGDAQRTAWVRSDPRISPATMVKPGDFGSFRFLWKRKLEYEPDASTRLTSVVVLDRLIGFRGFKSIAFVATQSQTVYAIDYDFGEPLWKYHVNYTASPPPMVTGTPDCPVGLSAAPSRPTVIAPSAAGGRGGGFGRGGRSGGGVGEPGKGATTLATAGQARGGGLPAGGPPAAGRGATAAAPGGPGSAVPGSAAAAAGNQPGGLPPGARQGGPGGGGFGGPFVPGQDAAYVIGSDGYLHALNVQNGWDDMTPALFLPANTRAAGLIVATPPEGAAIAYAVTTHRCGSQPDAVWAMDLANPHKAVTAFNVGDAVIAGSDGTAIGRDGTIFVTTRAGSAKASSSIFALDGRTLKPRATSRIDQGGFTTSPLVISWKDRDAAVAAGGGRLHMFDATSLTPLAASAPLGAPEQDAGGLASWIDAQGTRWIAATSARGIVAVKIVDEGGKPVFQAGWTSREIDAALAPLIVNGVLFTASGGTRSVPAVLYGIDAATGKDLWNSGRSITSAVAGWLAAGQGTIFVGGVDSTLYAFGFEIEK